VPYRAVISTQEGERALPCHRVIARLGAVPPRQLVESIGVRFLSSRARRAAELRLHTNPPCRPLCHCALAGYPLIKQAMNQGFEVSSSTLLAAPWPRRSRHLAAKSDPAWGGESSASSSLIHKGLPIFRDIQMLALRELLLVSRIVTPAKGSSIFARATMPRAVSNVLRGEVHLEAGGPRPMILARWPAARGR